MSRSINESIQTLKSSLTDINNSLKAKNIEGGEQLKVSKVAGLIDQIQAGGGGEDSFAILCTPFKFLQTMNIDFGDFSEFKPLKTLSGYDSCSYINFTDIAAPPESVTVDVSLNEDNSVIAWIEESTLYVSTQKEGKKIGFIKSCFDYENSFDGVNYFSNNSYVNERFGTFVVGSNINRIDLKNLYPLTTDLSNFFNQCGNLNGSLDLSHWKIKVSSLIHTFYNIGDITEIDISGLDMSDIMSGEDLSTAFSGSQLKIIYATEWINQFKFSNKTQNIFVNCSNLPNFDGSSKNLEYCKWKDNGGCFTNPAEKGN